MRIFCFIELLSSIAGKHSGAGDGEHEKNTGLVTSTTAHSHALNPRLSALKRLFPALSLVCSRDALLPFNDYPERIALPKLLHQPVKERG